MKILSKLLLLVAWYRTVCGEGPGFVMEEPRVLYSQTGDELVLRCTAPENRGSCQNVLWMYSSTECTTETMELVGLCRTIVQRPGINMSRFSLLYKDGASRLRITDLQLSDSGHYVCNEAVQQVRQRCATLRVTQTPTPICFANFSEVFQIGYPVELTCAVPADSQSDTKLTWVTGSSARSQITPPGSEWTVRHTLQSGDFNTQFMCIAGLNCIHGPKCTVTLPSITPTSVEILVSDGKQRNASFECAARPLTPVTLTYSWSVRAACKDYAFEEANTERKFEISEFGRNLHLQDTSVSACIVNLTCSCTVAGLTLISQSVIIPLAENTSQSGNVSLFDHHPMPSDSCDSAIYVWINLTLGGVVILITVLCNICRRRAGMKEKGETEDALVRELDDSGYEVPKTIKSSAPNNSEYMELNQRPISHIYMMPDDP